MDGTHGNDNGGHMDNYFSPSEITSILVEAADDLLRDGGGGGKQGDAAELLRRAGKYARLITIYNRAMAGGLSVAGDYDDYDDGSDRRGHNGFWIRQATRFYEEHLSRGRTHVVESLEREGQGSVVVTFLLLLRATEFFRLLSLGRYDEGWEVCRSLNLFPSGEGDMAEKVENFHSRLDTTVKQHLHQIVLGAMECAFNMYTGLRDHSGEAIKAINRRSDQGDQDNNNNNNRQLGRHDNNATAVSRNDSLELASVRGVQNRMRELSEQARIIVTFTGMINHTMPKDYNARIASWEAQML